MTKYSCIIVEDEPLARNLLEVYVSKSAQLQLLKTFGNPLEALDYLRNNEVDILFSDIQMPELTGLGLIKLLKKKPLTIITSAYSEFAIEGFELEVFDYMLKPITFERFLKSTEKAFNRLNENGNKNKINNVVSLNKSEFEDDSHSKYIFVKDGSKLVKVDLSEILYIEGLKDYVSIVLKSKKIISLQTLKGLEKTLPAQKFIRVHNSFIVAFEAIEIIEKEKIMINNRGIPISDTYRKAFKEFIDAKNMTI